MRLWVRPSEGLEPAGLLAHPRVEVAGAEAVRRLAGVGAVIAPAWVESHPPEVARAAAAGVPVVATARAAGFVALARCGREVPPGDGAALAAALDEVLDARFDRGGGAAEERGDDAERLARMLAG
jgi:glycosyltransferase involved in cell wall biosynthesis